MKVGINNFWIIFKMIICKMCKKKDVHYAKGLCMSCYGKVKRAKKKEKEHKNI